jgi:GNAT superfamily N-acetyltransferase
VDLGRKTEYQRAKRLLDKGRHPTFIGRHTLERAADQGGLIFATHDGFDIAVAIIGVRNGTLQVLNVLPAYRGKGVGSWFLNYLMPNFARVLESAVPWFEAQGYVCLGQPKQGRKLKTQIMVRRGLLAAAGRIWETHRLGCPCARCKVPADPEMTQETTSAAGCAAPNATVDPSPID